MAHKHYGLILMLFLLCGGGHVRTRVHTHTHYYYIMMKLFVIHSTGKGCRVETAGAFYLKGRKSNIQLRSEHRHSVEHSRVWHTSTYFYI